MVDIEKLPYYTADEVKKHVTEGDCWCIIYGIVYDLTKFHEEHPGGSEVVLEVAGEDATEAFENVCHSASARKLAEKYIIGKVKGASNPRICTRASAKCCITEDKKDGHFHLSGQVAIGVVVALAVGVIMWYFQG